MKATCRDTLEKLAYPQMAQAVAGLAEILADLANPGQRKVRAGR